MKIPTAILAVGPLGVLSSLLAMSVAAQNYPHKTIRLDVAQTIGGNADFVARTYAQRLAERFGQQVTVDNRPGAAGIIGSTPKEFAEHVAAEITRWTKLIKAIGLKAE